MLCHGGRDRAGNCGDREAQWLDHRCSTGKRRYNENTRFLAKNIRGAKEEDGDSEGEKRCGKGGDWAMT
jgi:hypothetical protein